MTPPDTEPGSTPGRTTTITWGSWGMAYSGYEDYSQQKLIVSVATTGRHQGKKANPNLPTQPVEVAQDVAACDEARASVVHMHARDERGEKTKSVPRYQELRDVINNL